MTHQDQTTQESMITLLRACGFDMHNIKHGQHQVKGTIENATAFFKLITAGADAAQRPAPVQQNTPVVGQEHAPRTALARVLEWEEFQRISDIPAVHEALQEFSDDPTGDNGVYIVREVLKATAPTPAASAQLDDRDKQIEGLAADVLRLEIALHKAQQPRIGLERFSEKMDALDAENPAPLERLMAAQGGAA